MSETTVIHSALAVSGGTIVADAWLRFDGPVIADAGAGGSWRDEPAARVVDAGGAILTPGFIDLHGHGGGGAAFDDGPEGIGRALAVHRAAGTTRSVISLVTASPARLADSLAGIARLADADPLVLGVHLEGPFLAPEFKGAHDPALLAAPEPAVADALVDAAAGTLRQITLAPELPGAADAIGRFTDAGVRVAVGHTAAGFDEALAAFDAGASILTHAFNGMRGIHHRAPGPVLAAMHADHVTLEVIADGIHLHPDVVRLAFAGAPGRIALITDAMAAAGASDGEYLLGGLEVRVDAGVARLADGTIAGSTLTQDQALRFAVEVAGIELPEAVRALTETPAAAIGRARDLGRLEAGYAADAVLLDDALEVRAVWAAGERLR
ncbi:N-acetylglucosamine-6-phosphate deacetylase [Agromyces archimandritae]|uniref:N-acetylglucosamine-6-phosphate deacetylase n=1 Tax=Agromyces archimandritae TaxID=2781962 RepID=A0A975FL41_9MICO|nr:N-acetylglucosamine-6-phosphate deacetylase [Agromyces archimandritae]QTX03944.1 N-acetylglucosamine-6-phosphate deacetylase [Agromyces archimandritae]